MPFVLIGKILIFLIQGCFVPSLLETCPVVLKKIFKLDKSISTIMLLSPLGKGHWLSFELTWIAFIQECFAPSLTETVSEENVNIRLSLFRNYLPWKKAVALYLNKFEFSPPRDALCQLVAKWFVKRRFF